MDVDKILNLERRTGIKDSDIGDFVDKASKVQQAIKDMLDGKINPEDVKIEGIETEEEKEEKERLRLERQKQLAEKNAQIQIKRKQEEIDRWWAGVELFKPAAPTDTVTEVGEENLRDPKEIIKARYSFEYSRWDRWLPNDEATKAEEEEKEKQLNDIKNKEFEKQNPEFCSQFLSDVEKRQQSVAKKQESSDISRLKGNRYFKARNFERALELYMEALKESPYDPKTLLNIAQVHIKTKCFEDGLEFTKRTLYLEPKNVKALSRRAFVLCEMKRLPEATEAILQALKLEPDNADLIALQKEIQIMQKEVRDEAEVASLLANDAAKPATSFEAIHRLKRQLADLNASGISESVGDEHSEQMKAISQAVRELLFSQHSGDSEAVTKGRTLFRTAGTLQEAAQYFQLLMKWELTAGKDGGVTSACLLQYAAEVARLVASMADEQRSSKASLVDLKLVSAAKALLLRSERLLSFADKAELELLAACAHLLLVCCRDDCCVKTRAAVLGDRPLVTAVGALLGDLSSWLGDCKDVAAVASSLLLVHDCVSILKALAFSDFAKPSEPSDNAGPAKTTALNAGCVVCSLGSAAASMRLLSKGWQLRARATVELAVEALLGLSRHEAFRGFFAVPLPGHGCSSVGVLLQAMASEAFQQDVVFCSNCLACLMNASLEAGTGTGTHPASAIRDEIVRAGGTDMLLAALQLSEVDRAKAVAAGGGNLLSRKAGLLSRLAPAAPVQQALLSPAAYRALCRRLAPPPPSDGDDDDKWIADERSHLVRVLACLGAPVVSAFSSSARCVCLADVAQIALEEALVTSLLSLFPRPREDCGLVTPQTVTLMPAQPAPAVLLGNAARCLMPLADMPACAEQLYGTHKKYQDLLGVEKLICAMATCGDMRVRKNIAILLAKGCKVGGGAVRDKISLFRGMQMMLELQDKL